MKKRIIGFINAAGDYEKNKLDQSYFIYKIWGFWYPSFIKTKTHSWKTRKNVSLTWKSMEGFKLHSRKEHRLIYRLRLQINCRVSGTRLADFDSITNYLSLWTISFITPLGKNLDCKVRVKLLRNVQPDFEKLIIKMRNQHSH